MNSTEPARYLIKVSIEDSGMIDNMIAIMSASIMNTELVLTKEQKEDLLDRFAKAYCKYFSNEELNTLATVYTLPVMKKFLDNNEVIMRDFFAIGEQFAKDHNL